MSEIWILDDDRSVRFVLAESLRDAGYRVRDFDNARAALSVLAHASPDVVFTDVRMPGTDGFQFLELLKRSKPDVPVIVMSAYTDIASTSAAFRGGAFDFLPKPFDLDVATRLVQRALAGAALTTVAPAASEVELSLLGESQPMRELFRAIGRVAVTDLNVLITGETGTGKELVARALHQHSLRARGPFVALNTAAIPAELLESELFGHEAGAFTGAHRRHVGRFEQAQGGTLFLDEIGDMPTALQTRLLRVLAEGEFYRVGGRELIRVDVRVIAATHQDLEVRVARGEFRADLLHRLDVVRLELPPLRARRDDIPLLADAFLDRATREARVESKRFSTEAMARLQAHDWPGNVRQLENLCRRLAVITVGREIGLHELPSFLTETQVAAASAIAAGGRAHPEFAPGAGASRDQDWPDALRHSIQRAMRQGRPGVFDEARELFDKTLLEAALELTRGHRVDAAKLLGIGRNTITRKLGSSRNRRG
ncbi:MAG TPA: nitrogen regulation protein NR(I) [Patescibacteria group bacterium]|nr:nitrogen regulation protein NR(I) [Patescibacteria group bacterium]